MKRSAERNIYIRPFREKKSSDTLENMNRNKFFPFVMISFVTPLLLFVRLGVFRIYVNKFWR